MKSTIKKSAIWATVVAVVLLTFILAKYFGQVFPSAAIAHKLATVVPNLVHLTKSLNLGQYRLDAGNILLVAFLVLLVFWRSLLIKKAQV